MDKPSFVYVTYIRSTPEKVWQAITQPEFARQYWGGKAFVSDWKKGSPWTDSGGPKTEGGCSTGGEVLESTPPKRLVLTWADPHTPEDTSRVTLEIVPAGDLVRLNIVHGDFKPGSVMAGKVSMGWPLVLSSMKSFLETGKGIDIWAAMA